MNVNATLFVYIDSHGVVTGHHTVGFKDSVFFIVVDKL